LFLISLTGDIETRCAGMAKGGVQRDHRAQPMNLLQHGTSTYRWIVMPITSTLNALTIAALDLPPQNPLAQRLDV
jgi:hypothetical protein